MPGLPHFKTVRFLAYSGNETMDAAAESGQFDWSGAFIPYIKKTYLAKDPKFVVSGIPLATAPASSPDRLRPIYARAPAGCHKSTDRHANQPTATLGRGSPAHSRLRNAVSRRP